MRAGRQRHRVQLQSATVTKNSFGEESLTWATYGNAWVSIDPSASLEHETSNLLVTSGDVVIIGRYNSAITNDHRVLFGTRTYEINSVTHTDERKRQTVMQCVEVK